LKILLALILLVGISFGKEFCIEEVDNDFNEPYLSYALLRIMERAVLETGGNIACSQNSIRVRLTVKDFREIPIAYTPSQRVRSYNLSISFEVDIDGKRHLFRGTVPYSLPFGGYGDIPRRKAIDDLLDKIYLNILKFLMGGKNDADKR